MKRHIATKVCTSLDHHAVTTVLGTGVVVDDLGHLRQVPQKPETQRNPNIPYSHQGIWLRRRQKRDGSTVLYSQSLHHACTQRIRITPWSAEIWWISGAVVVALRLLIGSQNTRRIKRDSNAKFAAPPHRRSTVMVEQVGKWNNRKLGRAYKTVYK
jgi:hypothetical protein